MFANGLKQFDDALPSIEDCGGNLSNAVYDLFRHGYTGEQITDMYLQCLQMIAENKG